ncbi:hypothetical protein Sango_2029300 [Sesamum angolense]|uniref:Uncharacterized protein n=1 Tax=Sesamum angolense TaxID=2727404 RepID=A0AAE1WFU0_9LAMI|nr:hypothetical protein Sango_2029300 [Sesamum angolense]
MGCLLSQEKLPLGFLIQHSVARKERNCKAAVIGSCLIRFEKNLGLTWEKTRGLIPLGWSMTLWVARFIWMALSGWVVSCLTVADEIAGSLRTGDIGAFHVG